MDDDHSLHAFFVYDVTIEAYCYTEGEHIGVDIKMDGTPTDFDTPHTFPGLAGTHNFTVPDADSNGHPFRQWSTGETSTTLTVTSGGTHTAYYLDPASVGGAAIPIGKLCLLAPYVGLISAIIVGVGASVIYVKRTKHRKNSQ